MASSLSGILVNAVCRWVAVAASIINEPTASRAGAESALAGPRMHTSWDMPISLDFNSHEVNAGSSFRSVCAAVMPALPMASRDCREVWESCRRLIMSWLKAKACLTPCTCVCMEAFDSMSVSSASRWVNAP
ncbi:hypothetical protein D3C84_590870 [compost metagenome]